MEASDQPAKFGAFVDLGDGIEGMIHIGDISHEKRLNHPSEALKVGEKVKAQVLEADKERRRVAPGDQATVSRPASTSTSPSERLATRLRPHRRRFRDQKAKVELGEGVFALGQITRAKKGQQAAASTVKSGPVSH